MSSNGQAPHPLHQGDKADEGQEEDYRSSDDEDFNPTTGPAIAEDDDADTSSDEDASLTSKFKKTDKRKKTVSPGADDLDADFANSGDEATIRKGKKRKKRRQGDHDADDGEEEDDEGGEGGLIKTRAQRAKEYVTTASPSYLLPTWKDND